jgi:tetratricopeptide (TPR) repeat protein
MHARFLASLILVWILIFVSPAPGQYREYYVLGKIVGPDNQPIPKVEILVQDIATSRSYSIATDEKGEYKLAGLPHGIYQVTIKKEGYGTKIDKWSFETPQDRMQKVEMQPIVLVSEEQIEKIERTKKAQSDINEAVENMQQGNFDSAIATLKKMIEDNPEDANAYYLLSLSYLKKNMLPEAIKALMRTTELAPNFAKAYNQLGICYQQQKELDKALESYEKALKIDPKLVDGWYNKGLILFELSRIPEALNCFEKALELKPDEPEFLEMAGRCYIHERDYSRAIDYLEKAKKGYSSQEKIEFLEQLISKLKEIQKQ